MRHKIIFMTLLIILIGMSNIIAQELNAYNLEAKWDNDSEITITYNLNGKADLNVELIIYLLSSDDSDFKIVVNTASGDIGKGNFLGKGRKVTWKIYSDYPDIEEGKEYYFKLVANYVEENKGWPWYYYAGGGIVAAAVAAVVGLGSSNEGTPQSDEFPLPPSRD